MSDAATNHLAEALLTVLLHDRTVSMIACDCGTDLEIYEGMTGSDGTTVEQVAELIEHATFGHATRRTIDVYRTAPLVTDYELGILLGLPAVTEAEEKWRQSRA